MKRYCLALDLADDPQLIREYKRHHENAWPEILQSLRDSGIEDLEIYLLGTRLFMIIEAKDRFSSDQKAQPDRKNHRVHGREQMQWKFKRPHPQATPRE